MEHVLSFHNCKVSTVLISVHSFEKERTHIDERMIQKKVLGTLMKQSRVTGRRCSRTSASSVLIALLLAGLSSIKVISSCVISPSESVAIVGDLSSFSCNARPNNQTRGSIQFIRLGSDGASGTYIFRPPKYGLGGRKISGLFLADGYFLSHLDDSHSNATIQINETQLKHGGQYFCICVESTSALGTANLTVLDKLSFVQHGYKPLTPGTLVELNCSVSFSGSTSSAVIDLTVNDANGTQVSSELNLPLTKNVTGHHVIHRKVVADPKDEQGFSCEVKIWNKSSTGESPLRSMTSNFSLNWDSIKSQTGALIAIAVVAGAMAVVPLVVSIVIFIYKSHHTPSKANGTVIAQLVGQRSSTASQDIRYEDANLSVQHRLHMMTLQNSDQPHYESIDREKRRIVVSDETYEELNSNDHSIQTAQYLEIIA